MFQRFTEQARQVVVLAQEEARTLGHPHIGTEHELLGLLRGPETIAGRVLAAAGVTADGARGHVVAIVGRRDEGPTGQMPFTPRAKALLEGALREMLELGHDHVGPEHLLLALTHRSDGNGVRVLRESGAEPEAVRRAVIETLAAEPAPGSHRDRRGKVTPRFSVAPDSQTQELLRAAAARALADGRDEYGVEDLRTALTDRPPSA